MSDGSPHSRESALAVRLASDEALRHYLQRDVTGEIAEQLIRLRRYRGLTQQELADRMGTTQSAVARHETSRSNISAKTVEKFLEALNAVVRVDLIPEECEALHRSQPRWYDSSADDPETAG